MNIGVSYTGSDAKHAHYIRWLKKNSAVNIITLSAETRENKGSIEDCDGLVLSGGIDIHPGFYNSNNFVYPNMPKQLYEKRDAFEISLFKTAQQRKLPVLGVCRGLQLINCILGGNLQQDIAARNSLHKAIVTEEKKQFDKAHGLHILPSTILADIAGTERTVVNSAHHQCVDNIATDLVANSMSDDNIIEGLEWKNKKDKPFLLCVQWHPERMHEFQLEDSSMAAGIAEPFFDAVQKFRQQ
jgi:putative glutamine amidotransferase